MASRVVHQKMRIFHRYLGFFLSGIMAVYAISGITLIFRDSDTFKRTTTITKALAPNLAKEELGGALKMKRLTVDKEVNGVYIFKGGNYTVATGEAVYKKKELPVVLKKMSNFHKAKSGDPLFFLNIFFGLSLLFFVISAFWMFMPQTSVFKKAILFAAIGFAIAAILVFI